MIRHDQPALLITSEDTSVADAIRKGECALGGRLNSDPASNAYQHALFGEDLVGEVTIEKGYVGFKKLEGKLAGKVDNPGAVAAAIGRKKYGKADFDKHAAEGKTFKPKKAAKSVCEQLSLFKAAKLFEKEDEVLMPEPYEPGKASYENRIRYMLDQLGELQNVRWQVERICREDKSFEKVKGVMESAYKRVQDEIKECAEKHAQAKKSLGQEESDLAKAIFVLTGMSYDEPRPENAVLKDTHGEQFSSDADKEVVNYLTTVEKINLEASPAHNPWGQPAFHGYPQVQKATSVVGEGHVPTARPVDGKEKDKVSKALDDLCKSGFASLASPMTPKKAHVDVSTPKVAAVKTPKMAPVAIKTPKALASARPVKAPKAGSKIGGKQLTAKSEGVDLYVRAFA